MALESPKNWWKPFSKDERIWARLIAVWAAIMFVMMPLGHYWGHNISQETYKTTPEAYQKVAQAFIDKYDTGKEEGGKPIVEPKPGEDVFIIARMYEWTPILKLKKGEKYRIHLSSLDLQHGFSLQPQNLNYQVLPGYDFVITMTPSEVGEFNIICNEYCMAGHHTMVGKMIVKE